MCSLATCNVTRGHFCARLQLVALLAGISVLACNLQNCSRALLCSLAIFRLRCSLNQLRGLHVAYTERRPTRSVFVAYTERDPLWARRLDYVLLRHNTVCQ